MYRIKFTLLTLACIFFGCQQAELTSLVENGGYPMKTVTISVGMDIQDTKASLDSQTGAFTWQSGDLISVLATDGKFYTLSLNSGAGEKNAEFIGSIPSTEEITTVAIYPAIVSDGEANTILNDGILNYTLPDNYIYRENSTNVPMVASFEQGANFLSFKQIGGVMRFNIKNLPLEADFVVTMNDKSITGQFPLELSNLGETAIVTGNNPSKVTIHYTSSVEGASADFNLPVPTGVYDDFNVSLVSNGNTIFSKDYSAFNKVERCTLLNMSECEVLPQFSSFSINGSAADNLYAEFIDVQLPYGTDVTKLKPSFQSPGNTVMVNGEEQTSGESEIDFSNPVVYSIVTEEGVEYKHVVSISYSQIPVIYIQTENSAPITSKDDWLEGTTISLTNAGKYNKIFSNAEIKGRGNTTWNYPKKPYAVKLDSKESVLGMPKHKRWVLLANYVDKTCLRNSIAFEIARRSSGLEWTPRGQHVDVVLNGVFLGNYYLCEQIKIDKNRVDITEMESADIDQERVTGGYLLEIDKNFDEVNKFYSPIRNMPFMIKEPDADVLAPEQLAYIQNHITEIENALYGEDSTTEGYLKYIDLDSFIDYWFVYELTSTGEPTHPKSVYMYKDRGGKIHAGPVWDFDYFTFQPYYNDWFINMNAVWNDRIINDPANRAAIKARWEESREKYRTISDEIDRQFEVIRESAEYNAILWPLNLNVNRDDALSVEDAVTRIKQYYDTKFSYADSYFANY